MRDLSDVTLERARDFAALRTTTCSSTRTGRAGPCRDTAPTLVIHGTADPMFPLPHGQALARELPSARLLRLEGRRPRRRARGLGRHHGGNRKTHRRGLAGLGRAASESRQLLHADRLHESVGVSMRPPPFRTLATEHKV